MSTGAKPIVFNAEGILCEPNIHDGFLESISSRDGVLELGVLHHAKSVRFRLCFPGIGALACNTFLQGNIVFEIAYRNQSEGGGFSSPFAGVSADVVKMFETYHATPARFSAVLTLASSYGAELLAAGDIITTDCYYFQTDA